MSQSIFMIVLQSNPGDICCPFCPHTPYVFSWFLGVLSQEMRGPEGEALKPRPLLRVRAVTTEHHLITDREAL